MTNLIPIINTDYRGVAIQVKFDQLVRIRNQVAIFINYPYGYKRQIASIGFDDLFVGL